MTQLVNTCAAQDLPALVTTDHVAIVVGEAADAARDVRPVAAIF